MQSDADDMGLLGDAVWELMLNRENGWLIWRMLYEGGSFKMPIVAAQDVKATVEVAEITLATDDELFYLHTVHSAIPIDEFSYCSSLNAFTIKCATSARGIVLDFSGTPTSVSLYVPVKAAFVNPSGRTIVKFNPFA